MFLWFPVLDLARAPRRTARKKGSGYENGEYQKALPLCINLLLTADSAVFILSLFMV
jgi:hypothetical protein